MTLLCREDLLLTEIIPAENNIDSYRNSRCLRVELINGEPQRSVASDGRTFVSRIIEIDDEAVNKFEDGDTLFDDELNHMLDMPDPKDSFHIPVQVCREILKILPKKPAMNRNILIKHINEDRYVAIIKEGVEKKFYFRDYLSWLNEMSPLTENSKPVMREYPEYNQCFNPGAPQFEIRMNADVISRIGKSLSVDSLNFNFIDKSCFIELKTGYGDDSVVVGGAYFDGYKDPTPEEMATLN